jgi:hypothetical protein
MAIIFLFLVHEVDDHFILIGGMGGGNVAFAWQFIYFKQ